MTTATALRDLLGPATPSEQFLRELAGEILAPATTAPVKVTVTRAAAVPYDFGSPATGSRRVHRGIPLASRTCRLGPSSYRTAARWPARADALSPRGPRPRPDRRL